MARYQWLFFDADDTLFDFQRAEAAALRLAFQRHDLVFHPDCLTTYREINHTLWQALEKGQITPPSLHLRRFELLFAQTGITRISPADFGASYLQCLGGCAQLIDGTADILAQLRTTHRIAILTNGLQAVQRARLERSAIRPHIAEIIISEEVGAAKPAKAFFDAAFARLGHPAKPDVLMIGDNWTSDIQGAAAYGLDTCWFNPRRRPRPDHPPITREIASLHELSEWLAAASQNGSPPS